MAMTECRVAVVGVPGDDDARCAGVHFGDAQRQVVDL